MLKGGLRSSVCLLESSPCTDKMLSANSDTVVVADGPASTHTNMLKGTDSNLRVLCLGWNPVEDTVVLARRRKVYTQAQMSRKLIYRKAYHLC